MKQRLKDSIKQHLPYSISFRMITSISLIVLLIMLLSNLFTYFYFGKVLKGAFKKRLSGFKKRMLSIWR